MFLVRTVVLPWRAAPGRLESRGRHQYAVDDASVTRAIFEVNIGRNWEALRSSAPSLPNPSDMPHGFRAQASSGSRRELAICKSNGVSSGLMCSGTRSRSGTRKAGCSAERDGEGVSQANRSVALSRRLSALPSCRLTAISVAFVSCHNLHQLSEYHNAHRLGDANTRLAVAASTCSPEEDHAWFRASERL